jgi:Flp pilus assembly protein TadD
MTMDGAKRRSFLTSGAFLALMLAISGCATTGGAADPPPALTAPDAIRAGDDAARRGEFERALAHYLRAVGIEETLDGWLRVGAACDELGNHGRAVMAYEKVLQLDAEHVDSHEGAGLAYLALGNGASAAAHLRRAVELDQRRWRSHNALGILADRAKDHGAAALHYLAALDVYPSSPMVLNNLGYSRYLSGDLEQAARDFYRATQASPDYKPAWANLGMVYAEQGWYADAINVLAKTVDRPKAHNDVGLIAYRRGDFEQAELLLSEAVRLSPSYYPTAHENLNLVRARLQGGSSVGAVAPMTGSRWPMRAVTGDEG